MRTRRAFTSFATAASIAIGLMITFGGCSSSPTDTPTVVPDTGINGTQDTGSKTDTGQPDTSPADTSQNCDQPLASDYACPPRPKVTPGSTKCTEDLLQGFADACVSPKGDYSTPKTCAPWKSAHADCSKCIESFTLPTTIIPGKIYPDRDKCYWDVLDDACATSVNCYFDCGKAVCDTCDKTKGSGTTTTKSEQDDCLARANKRPSGACYSIASGKAQTCFSDNNDLITPCIVGEMFQPTGSGGRPDPAKLRDGVVSFYRGSCRDNANWTNSTDPGDAGTD